MSQQIEFKPFAKTPKQWNIRDVHNNKNWEKPQKCAKNIPLQSGTMSVGVHSPTVSAQTYSPSVGAVRGMSNAELHDIWHTSPWTQPEQDSAPFRGAGSSGQSKPVVNSKKVFLICYQLIGTWRCIQCCLLGMSALTRFFIDSRRRNFYVLK